MRTYVPGLTREQIQGAQPNAAAIRAHLLELVNPSVIEPWALNEIDFWVAHAQRTAMKRREFDRMVASGQDVRSYTMAEIFPNAY